MQGIEIVLLGPGDLPRLLAVADGLFDEPINPGWSAAFLADPMNLIVLAHDGDLAVGMATGTILRHPDKPPWLFVNELGTREGWQRRGIATALMARLQAAVRARNPACNPAYNPVGGPVDGPVGGCAGVWVVTEADNDAAQALYRSLGSIETPTVVHAWDIDDHADL